MLTALIATSVVCLGTLVAIYSFILKEINRKDFQSMLKHREDELVRAGRTREQARREARRGL